MRKIFSPGLRFVFVMLLFGLLSPSVKQIGRQEGGKSGPGTYTFTLLHVASARRGGGMRGGGMRSSGMRSGGMRSSMGSRSISRPSSPRNSRYYGGNFQSYNRSAVTRPASSRPASSKPSGRAVRRASTRPSIQPVEKPGSGGKHPDRPGRPGKPHKPHKPFKPGKPHKPNRPGRPDGPTTPVIKPPQHKPGRPGVRPPGHRPGRPGRPGVRPPHHGHHHGHHHFHHYPYHGMGGYWPWFWGSAIAAGAYVSVIPDEGCIDVQIEGIYYKQCDGVLFEPVYEGDDIRYRVVEINR